MKVGWVFYWCIVGQVDNDIFGLIPGGFRRWQFFLFDPSCAVGFLANQSDFWQTNLSGTSGHDAFVVWMDVAKTAHMALDSICSGNGLVPFRHQAITWTNVDEIFAEPGRPQDGYLRRLQSLWILRNILAAVLPCDLPQFIEIQRFITWILVQKYFVISDDKTPSRILKWHSMPQ